MEMDLERVTGTVCGLSINLPYRERLKKLSYFYLFRTRLRDDLSVVL